MGVISGGKKEKFYGENLMSYPGGMPGPQEAGPNKPGDTDPPIATEELKGVTVHGSKSKIGANDQKVLNELKDSGRKSTSIKAATETYGGKIVQQHLEASGADTALYNKTRAYEGPSKHSGYKSAGPVGNRKKTGNAPFKK